MLLLNLEDFKMGWPAYEYRWKKSKLDSVPVISSRPKWRLGDRGKVLVWGEQGIGDEIMFSSLIPDLHKACSQLIVKADKRLIPILRRSFPKDIAFCESDTSVSEGDYDAHIAMGSLPLHFRPNIESFKTAAQGYLSADGKRAAVLRDRLLSDGSKMLIGLSWHSTSKIRVAQKRTISLGQLARAFQAENVKFVSLQYGDMDDEINRVRQDHGIDVAQVEQIDNFNDIDGLAALITACDRIVSIDNVTVHLAGALGKEIDALLPRVSNWRWGIHPHNSYWYNSVRLRRQTEREDWAEVLAQIS
jgi:ADP-heptose:LPS heptosyltransferase